MYDETVSGFGWLRLMKVVNLEMGVCEKKRRGRTRERIFLL